MDGAAAAQQLDERQNAARLLAHEPSVGRVVAHGIGNGGRRKARGDAAAAPTIGHEGDEQLQGRSQIAGVRGERSRTRGDEILSATHYGSVDKARLTTPYWTYIRNYAADHVLTRGEHELYLPEDIGQFTDVADDHPAVVEALSAQLESQRETLRADSIRWELEITMEEQQQLEALGYVD